MTCVPVQFIEFLKQESGIFVNKGLLGKVKDPKLVHPSKAESPMEVTLSGIVIEVNPVY
jgi:hypothetical protein